MIPDLRHTRDVIITLVGRDFHSRYRNTALGLLWALLSPLLFLTIFYLMFRVVLNLGIKRYASFAFTGILVWGWFQAALSQAVVSISSNASLVVQPRFPIATLPCVAVAANLVAFLIALPLLLGFVVIEGAHLSWSLLALPMLFALQFIFTLSLCYLVAALNVSLRDVQYILPVLLQAGYYATPIFYDLHRMSPRLQKILMLNPMAWLIDAYRTVLILGRLPNLAPLSIFLGASLLMLIVGYRYFVHASHRFLEEL
jgi:lipopolysaccharide transport system permease protein